jgi:hypothetical protein
MRRMLLRAVFAVLLLGTVPLAARGNTPGSPFIDEAPNQYKSINGCNWGMGIDVTTAQSYVRTGTTATWVRPQIFPWGTQIKVRCLATSYFCWTQDTSVSIASAAATAGYVNDAETGALGGSTANPDGPGSCVQVNQYVPSWTRLHKRFFDRGNVAYRPGYCTGNATMEGYPCTANADCLNASGATCATRSSMRSNIGAYLIHIAPVNTTCFVCAQR